MRRVTINTEYGLAAGTDYRNAAAGWAGEQRGDSRRDCGVRGHADVEFSSRVGDRGESIGAGGGRSDWARGCLRVRASAYATGNIVAIDFDAAETWTNTAQGTYIAFGTSAIGAATLTERMRLQHNGGLSLGHTVNPGAGSFSLTGHYLAATGYTTDVCSSHGRSVDRSTAPSCLVETLVAQSTAATIGGRVIVAPTNILTADLAPAGGTITVKQLTTSRTAIGFTSKRPARWSGWR